jgi:hypothetical protein
MRRDVIVFSPPTVQRLFIYFEGGFWFRHSGYDIKGANGTDGI